MNTPDIYFITGISGSGKTTVGRKLMDMGEVVFDSKIQKGLFHFADSSGHEAIDYHPEDKEWQQQFSWRLNKVMFDRLLSENSTVRRVFLCGGADDVKQYWPLGKEVFLLVVDSSTMLSRLNSVTRDNAFGRDEATQDKLVERLERFQKSVLTRAPFQLMPSDQ